eukprot:SAG22_NODE_48_length_24654_cov_4.406394_11_plen_102_part_00
MELPPKDWLATKFPGLPWKSMLNSFFVNQWHTYTMSFERVLSEWSGGNFSSSRSHAPQPLAGLMQSLVWSRQRAEAKQAELIGMTSVVEVAGDIFSRAETM